VAYEGTEKEVIERLAAWMERHPYIKAALLTSSRANQNAYTDKLSDYDVVLVVSDMTPFATDDSWTYGYGEVLVSFEDKSEIYGSEGLIRLVLYEDGTKIDYVIWPVEVLKRLLEEPELPENLDVGYRVLLDKANLTAGMEAPTYRAHIPRRPTEEEFNDLVNEFWWESTYVAKNLWRDDVFHSKYSFDVVMRFQLLLKMLEWYVETQHNWSLKPGRLGRGLKKHLPHEIWADVEATLAGAEVDENWIALFGMTNLFRRIAVQVANSLGYAYPQALDERVSSYLQRVKNLPQ
jgi:aminoglycoside 6-adenylyltransferase